MWIAEEKDLYGRVGEFLFEIFEIDAVCVVVFRLNGMIDKFAGDELTAIVANRREETIVNRSLYEHLVTGHCHSFDDSRYGRNDSASIDKRVAFDLPAMATLKPVDSGFIIGFRYLGISEDAVSHATLKSIENRWSYAEIHVGDP